MYRTQRGPNLECGDKLQGQMGAAGGHIISRSYGVLSG